MAWALLEKAHGEGGPADGCVCRQVRVREEALDGTGITHPTRRHKAQILLRNMGHVEQFCSRIRWTSVVFVLDYDLHIYLPLFSNCVLEEELGVCYPSPPHQQNAGETPWNHFLFLFQVGLFSLSLAFTLVLMNFITPFAPSKLGNAETSTKPQ